MKCLKALSILILLVTQIQSFAQQNNYSLYTSKNGLPSEILYDIVQAENGYLWISTEGGLVKFNGKEFIKNPLPPIGQKEILNIFPDSQGRLWFTSLPGEVFYLEDGKAIQLDRTKYLLDRGFIDITEDQQGRLWLTARYGQHISILNVSTLEKVKSLDQNSHDLVNIESICHYKDRNVINCVGNVYELSPDDEMKKLRHTKKNNRFFFKPKLLNDSTYILSINKKKLITVNPNNTLGTELDKIFKPDYNSIQHIFVDDDKSIFVSTSNGLYILKRDKNGKIHQNHILENFNTRLVVKDKEQNYWVATDEGLIRLSSFDIEFFESGPYGRFTALAATKENLFVGTDKNRLLVYNNELELISKDVLSTNMVDDIVYEMVTVNENLYLATNRYVYSINTKKKFSPTLLTNGFYKSIEADKNENLWLGGGYNGLYIDTKLKEQIQFPQDRTYAIFPIDSSNILLGTVNGLYRFNFKTKEKIKLIKEFNEDVRDIKMSKDSTFWLATQNSGVFVIKNDNIVKIINTNNGLSSNNCRSLLIQDNHVWLATNKGLARINKENNEIKIISESIGLPSNEIHDIMYWNELIVAATSDGLAILKPDKEISNLCPILNISSVKIIEKDTSILSTYDLSPKQRNIKIEFDGVSFHNVNDIIFEYKMQGIDKHWIKTKNNIAQYPSMPPGQYTFRVKTKGINSGWSEVKSIRFNLSKKFHEYSLFYFLVFLGLSMLVFWYFREIKKKDQVKKALHNSQLTALRAQMNPHFIFNSLNSLSYFIENGEKRVANKYVSQFSKLMRLILNNSDKAYIPLKEELDALRLYVSLEALRFDDDLFYVFDIGENIDENQVGIPPLLVQPYVENAILHGLKPKKGKKSLKIIIRQIREKVSIIVEDNGIGRHQSQINKAMNKQIYNSKAMGITSQRIDLININSKKSHNLIIEDLLDQNQNAMGTRVNLNLDWINLKLKQND